MKFICVFMCIYFSCCYTAEVDQFTSRLQFQGLKDSSEIINTKANEFLKKSIDEANKESSNCDEDILYRKMRNYFANHQKGDLTIFAIHDASVDRIKIRIDESIYKNWSFSSGALISKNAKKLSDMTLSPLIKIGSQVIGTDKLEHLFGRGFAYFTDYYKEKKSLNDTLYTGTYQERWIYGGNPLATGVFSYADLAANFNGLRFWNHVLLKRDDVMGKDKNLGPYVRCENNKFIFNHSIDFKEYFDAAHDEGINCSKFATQSGLSQFLENLKQLSHNNHQTTFECPMDKNLLEKIKDKYQNFSSYFINEQGSSIVSMGL